MAAIDVNRNRLVIGLDYGTTFTGVAWQVAPNNQIIANPRHCNIIMNWGVRNSRKTPSEISYDATTDHRPNWGFHIGKESNKIMWTKLQLDQQTMEQELKWMLEALKGMQGLKSLPKSDMQSLPSYPAKEPVSIVADYLSRVREAVVKELEGALPGGKRMLADLPTELVITVPAMWSKEARNLTFRAAVEAGFSKRYFKGFRAAYLITEPEAAALYTIKTMQADDPDEDIIMQGDCFVQADMGGGTVDCVSYRILRTSPALSLEQIGIGTSFKCGATFIDRKFLELLRKKLGEENFGILSAGKVVNDVGTHTIFSPAMQQVLEQFEQIKIKYDGTLDETRSNIQFPGDLYGLDDPANGINEGVLTLTNSEMAWMFKFSVDKIMALIHAQLTEIELAGRRVRYILLSGGFGESKYVQKLLREFGNQRTLEVLCAPNPIQAVAIGAVAMRLEHNSTEGVRMMESSKSYGVVLSQPYSAHLHSPEDKYIDPYDKAPKAKEQVVWLIKRGDLIQSDEPKTGSIGFFRKFGLADSKTFITKFVAYGGPDYPQSFAKVPHAEMQVLDLKYNLDPFRNGSLFPSKGRAFLAPHARAFLTAEVTLDKKKNGTTFTIYFENQIMQTQLAPHM